MVPYRRLSQLAAVTNRELGWLLEGEAEADHELVERLVTVVEELSAEAKRIGAVAERLERLLGGPRTAGAGGPDPAA